MFVVLYSVEISMTQVCCSQRLKADREQFMHRGGSIEMYIFVAKYIGILGKTKFLS